MELFRWTKRNYFLRLEDDTVINMYDFFELILQIIPHEELRPITEDNTIVITCESIFNGDMFRIKIDYNARGSYNNNKVWDLSWDKVDLLNKKIIQKLMK